MREYKSTTNGFFLPPGETTQNPSVKVELGLMPLHGIFHRFLIHPVGLEINDFNPFLAKNHSMLSMLGAVMVAF